MVPEITPGPDLSASHGIARQTVVPRLELTVPNLITLARLLSVPVAVWLLLDERYAAAFWLFVAAGASDGLDGYIAKRFDRRTRLGAMLDPAADKLLLAGVAVTLGFAGQLPVWLVVLMVLRDALIVAGVALICMTGAPRRFEPLSISKANTLVQIALVGFVLARLGLDIEAGPVTRLLIAVVAVTTVWSGFSYLVRWARILAGRERRPDHGL